MRPHPCGASAPRRPGALRSLAVAALSVSLAGVVAAGPATATPAGTAGELPVALRTASASSALPSVPLRVTATLVGPGRVKVAWAAPSSAGSTPVTGYVVTYLTSQSGGGQGVGATARTAEFTGLETTRYTYSFAVWASNAAGDGPRVTVPLTVPTPPVTTPTQTVSRTTLVTGDRLTISGRGKPGTRVTIDRALPGRAFIALATVTVDSAGRYTHTTTPRFTATYRTRTAAGLVSKATKVVAQNRLSLGATRQAFRTYAVGGLVLPAVKGQRVNLYATNASGSYVLLGVRYTDVNGRWSFSHRYSATRTYAFKAVSVATAVNASGAKLLSVVVR